MAYQSSGVSIVYSTVWSGADKKSKLRITGNAENVYILWRHHVIPFHVLLLLQNVRLSAMGLAHIEVGAFCYLRQVFRLNLNPNKLQSLPELCSLKCSLVTLLLSYDNLSKISKDFFARYKKLKNLSNNKLVLLPDLHWIEHSLKDIRASRN